jgi:hypothetical protein
MVAKQVGQMESKEPSPLRLCGENVEGLSNMTGLLGITRYRRTHSTSGQYWTLAIGAGRLRPSIRLSKASLSISVSSQLSSEEGIDADSEHSSYQDQQEPCEDTGHRICKLVLVRFWTDFFLSMSQDISKEFHHSRQQPTASLFIFDNLALSSFGCIGDPLRP